MTLPLNVTLPILSEANAQDPYEIYSYLKKLAYVLSTHIQRTNQCLNGSDLYFTDDPALAPPFKEFIIGSTTPGTATYTNTTLAIRTINLITFVWFDIKWSLETGTGNLLIQLPYFASDKANFPFVGVIESDSMTYTAGYTYLTGNIAPNTNTIQIDQNGSGLPLIALPITAAGHLRGSIVYATS